MASVSHSVMVIINAGQMSALFSPIVISETGMIIPARGTANRFVSRKCCGKLLKYIHARGPVVIWHEIDNDALSHILHMIPLVLSLYGQKFFRAG